MANHQDDQGNEAQVFMALHGEEKQSSIYDGTCVPPPTSLQMTGPTSSTTLPTTSTSMSVPTSWLSSMMGLPSMSAPTGSGFASTSMSAPLTSGLAPTSLTASTGSGSALVAAEVKESEDEARARELHELARQRLQVALREEGENVEYDVNWELIRRATESLFQPGDLSLATAFQTLGWMEVDDGSGTQPPLPIQDVPSPSPQPESWNEAPTPQLPPPLHPSLPPNATHEEIRKAAVKAYPRQPDEPETPVIGSVTPTVWGSPARMKYLDWYLEHMQPRDHPDYVDAYQERWNEFYPGHHSLVESDWINIERWKKKAAAGQPVLPEALRPTGQNKMTEKDKQQPQPSTSTSTCPHRRTTRKGTNKYYEMETCLDCNQLLRRDKKDQKTGRHGQAGGLHGVHAGERPSNSSYRIDQVQSLFQMCQVVAKVKAMEDPHQALTMDQLHRILDAVAVGYAQETSMNEFEKKGKGKGRQERHGYMSLGDGEEDETTSEKHLFVLLDSGCNKTCHGEHWLQRYQRAVGIKDFPMSEDNGGNFNGIGGKISTNGIRHLDVSFELEDGGLAVGDLTSVELAGSEASSLSGGSKEAWIGVGAGVRQRSSLQQNPQVIPEGGSFQWTCRDQTLAFRSTWTFTGLWTSRS